MEILISPSNVDRKFVDDYEFCMTTGSILPLTIDLTRGDTIEFSGKEVVLVHLAPKPSISDPERNTPGEDITIFTAHLASIHHRVREVSPLTVDQQIEWNKTLRELHGTVQ